MTLSQYKSGLEKIRDNPKLTESWGQCGYLCNQASVGTDFKHGIAIIHEALGDRLISLFGPQHGIYGTVQDNMIETGHGVHAETGRPIFSLYSETRIPTEEMLANIDTLVFDLQISGCRVYTFKWTLKNCLKAAKQFGKKLVVLDRPNPLGGIYVEGNTLDEKLYSFVGEYPLPMRHGLTVAECALLFNKEIGAELECILLDDWDPNKVFGDLGVPWVMTSPNLPTLEALYVYPGMVMFEGCNLSEGRGTTLPFQFIGAPYIQNSELFVKRVRELYSNHGVYLRPVEFMPTYHKWKDQVCYGLQIHVVNPYQVDSFRLAIAILTAAQEIGRDAFQWKQPPYEYNFNTLPIKLILGKPDVDSFLRSGDYKSSFNYWQTGIENYLTEITPILQYERQMRCF